ncbi:MAG: hypothetical protein GY697_07440, partial [Desulfobacterales bacterium]|nr:hypothetical protein [Desulfobacterales bacterium]
TGMYLHNHRCVSNGTPVDRNFDNWALKVRGAGYDPSLFGYTDAATDPRGLSDNDSRLTHYTEPLPGIGSYTPHKADVSIDWVHSLVEKGYPIPPVLWDLYGIKTEGVDWAEGGEVPLPLAIKTEDHETHFMVDKCLHWIKGQQSSWVTHLSLLRPHPPFSVPEPYNLLYEPATLDLPNRQPSVEVEAQQHPVLEYAQKMLSWRMRHTYRGMTEIFLSEDGPVTRRSPAQKLARIAGYCRAVNSHAY